MITPTFVVLHFLLSILFLYFVMLVGNFLIQPRFNQTRKKIAWFLPFLLAIVLTEYVCPLSIRAYVRIAISFAFLLWMYRGGIGKKLLVLALYYIMIISSEVLAASLVTALGIMQYFDANGLSVVIGIIFMLMFLLIRNIKRSIESHIGWRTWFKIVYCSSATIAMAAQLWITYFLYIGKGEINLMLSMKPRDIATLILIILQVGVVYMLFSIIHEMNSNAEALNLSRMDEMKARHDLEQSQTMLKNVETVHRLQHDMKNHLLAIDSLSGNPIRQHTYILQLTAELHSETMLEECGNRLIDSLIAYKMAAMTEKDIRFEPHLSLLPENVNLDEVRLCAVITNALDNAIEACMRLPPETPRWITLAIREEDGSLYLKITNPSQDAEEDVSKALRKKIAWFEKAGTGMESIRRSIQMLNGEMTLTANSANNEVSMTFFVPASVTAENHKASVDH